MHQKQQFYVVPHAGCMEQGLCEYHIQANTSMNTLKLSNAKGQWDANIICHRSQNISFKSWSGL